MTRKTLAGTALAALTLGAVLAGCGSGTDTDTGHDMSSMSGSATTAPAAG